MILDLCEIWVVTTCEYKIIVLEEPTSSVFAVH